MSSERPMRAMCMSFLRSSSNDFDSVNPEFDSRSIEIDSPQVLSVGPVRFPCSMRCENVRTMLIMSCSAETSPSSSILGFVGVENSHFLRGGDLLS